MPRIKVFFATAVTIAMLFAMLFATGCTAATTSGGAAKLAMPTKLSAVADDSQVILTWAEVAGATGYHVYYSTQPTIDLATAKKDGCLKVTGAETNAIIQKLTNGTAYYFVVSAFNPSTESAPCQAVSATPVLRIKAPAAPANLKAKAVTRAYEINLSWDATPDATTYTLYRGNSAGFALDAPDVRKNTFNASNVTNMLNAISELNANNASTNIDTTHFADQNLSPGATLYYKVVASNSAGDSPASEEAVARTAPAIPSGFSVVPKNKSAELRWKPVLGAALYKLYWSTDSTATIATEGSSSETITAVEGEFVTKTVTKLINNTELFFIVTAIDTSGLESPGSSANKATPALQAVNAPRSLRANATGTSIKLTWEAPETGTFVGYKLYRSTRAGSKTEGEPLKQLADTEYVDLGLSKGTTYYYWVISYSSIEEFSQPSNEAHAATVPAAPLDFARKISATSVVLTWTVSPAASGYKIYRERTGSDTKAFLSTLTGGNSTAHNDTSIEAAVEYCYSILAFNDAGESSPSQVTALTISAAPVLDLPSANSSDITLNWKKVTGATGYKLYRSTATTALASLHSAKSAADIWPIDIADANTTTYADSTASTTEASIYSITSYNPSGESVESNKVNATRCDPVPAAPSRLEAQPLTGADTGKIAITWNTCEFATKYSLYWSNTNPVDITEANRNVIKGITEPRYIHATHDPGFKYFYVVLAHNATQTSAASGVATAISALQSTTQEPLPVRPAITHRGVGSPMASNNIPFVLNRRLYRVESCSWNPAVIAGSYNVGATASGLLAQSKGVSIVDRDNYIPATDGIGSDKVVTIGESISAVLPAVLVDKDPENHDAETVFLFAVDGSNLSKVWLFTSTDAKTWTEKIEIFEYPSKAKVNDILFASVVKSNDSYTMMIGRNPGADGMGIPHATFFRAQKLRGPWSIIANAQFSAYASIGQFIPSSLYYDSTSQYFYLFIQSDLVNQPYISRTRDLQKWEASPFGRIFIPTRKDSSRLFYPASSYSQEQRALINSFAAQDPFYPATALNIRLCDYLDAGVQKVIIEYNNRRAASGAAARGSAAGEMPTASSFEAEYVGTMSGFLAGFFPAGDFPTTGWDGISREIETDAYSTFSMHRSAYGRIISTDVDVELKVNTGWADPAKAEKVLAVKNAINYICPLFQGSSNFAWGFLAQGIAEATATITLPSIKTLTGILIYNRDTSAELMAGCRVEVLDQEGNIELSRDITNEDLLTQQVEIDLLGQNIKAKAVRFIKPSGTMHFYHVELWGG